MNKARRHRCTRPAAVDARLVLTVLAVLAIVGLIALLGSCFMAIRNV